MSLKENAPKIKTSEKYFLAQGYYISLTLPATVSATILIEYAYLVLKSPKALLLSPSERHVSTIAQSDVTLPESSCTDFNMTDSSIMCFTSFFRARNSFSFWKFWNSLNMYCCRINAQGERTGVFIWSSSTITVTKHQRW